jgi:hypothetical protein
MGCGRVERMSALRDMLVAIRVRSMLERSHPEHDPDFQTRWAAHSQLCAILDFIYDDPQVAGLVPDLQRLLEAINDIDKGIRIPWLMPAKKPGQPPLKTTVNALRGRYAAVMDFLMKRGGLSEIEAAKYVVRHGKPEPLMRGTADPWKVVQDWRQKVIGDADDTEERSSFLVMWDLIEQRGFDQNPEQVRSEAERLLLGLSGMAAEENPTNPSC